MQPKRLVLVRHAKSSWADPDIIDHDRPLNARGRRAAPLVGRHLRQAGLRPDLVLCSSATRARQTLELLRIRPGGEVLVEDQLYGAGASELLTRLGKVPAAIGTVLLIGHSPGIEELARLLIVDGDALIETFPTCAVADLLLPIRTWKELDSGVGRLHAFVIPRDLG